MVLSLRMMHFSIKSTLQQDVALLKIKHSAIHAQTLNDVEELGKQLPPTSQVYVCVYFAAVLYVGRRPVAETEPGSLHLFLFHSAVQTEDAGGRGPTAGLPARDEPC